MKQSSLFRAFLTGVLISCLLGVASFFGLRAINESSTGEVRRHMILFMAQTIESGPYAQSVQEYRSRTGRRSAGSYLWVFSADGKVLASNSENPPPVSLSSLKKPTNPHEFSFYYRTFRLIPDLTLIKLDPQTPNPPGDTYLLIEALRPTTRSSTAWIYVAFFLFVIGVAVLIAFSLIYLYLKKQSLEARQVLARLEKGDLQARFEIKRIDTIGSLMHDFNRMASEIERLVHRVQETEMTRKNLLAELSHDIRTPLTSLKTSIETLSEHLDEMPKAEQKEFLDVSRAELTYFLRLIDDLFFIADLGEPRYKKDAQKIDLLALLSEETKSRQAQEKFATPKSEARISWELKHDSISDRDAAILGDPLLIQRLFRNALDNAAKHARSKVQIQFSLASNDSIQVQISDDGKGISDEAIALFGQRRKQRVSGSEARQGASLGLGSVIMKTILELHGGDLKISRSNGTLVTITLPREHLA